MFSKILIANRGEIAVRIIRACKELGIKTVAVYSDVDSDSLHVQYADEAICIGSASSKDSYLNIPSIISAAEIADVEAIHPGYGFLAENAHFAEICKSCQIQFIGPSPEIIRLMGNKSEALQTMKKAGLPIMPGSNGIIKDKDEALEVAKEIGYPVMIKASAGGGGKGMRIAHNDGKLVSLLMTAQAEANAAFGNADMYIEKYLQEPKHVEFQILGDNFGNIIHLGERDCTVQRRHQKLIEESPAPAMTDELRTKMGNMSVKGAKQVNYASAGTMEFLLDKNGKFYFMEMNTRLQVEHPVTELVTGVDIVKEQIKIAAGEKLQYTQDSIKQRGWAIECRINAEDAKNKFLPSPGVITGYHCPGGPGVRVDSYVYNSYSVQPFYDSLISKLIVLAGDRNQAIERMQRALDEYVINGIKTTIDFHKLVFKNPTFQKGIISTDFVENLLGKRVKK